MARKIFAPITSLAPIYGSQLPAIIPNKLSTISLIRNKMKSTLEKIRNYLLLKEKKIKSTTTRTLVTKPLQTSHPNGLILSTRGCKTVSSQPGIKLLTSEMPIRVCILGANSKIAEPLALMLKESPLVDELVLHDNIHDPLGMAIDLSHIDTPVRIYSHFGFQEYECALTASTVIALTGGYPGSPSHDNNNELFSKNIDWVTQQIEAICHYCPCAHIVITTQPVNSLVPHATEVMKRMNCYAPRRLYGITSVDIIRACTFFSELIEKPPESVYVPVIGGTNNGTTIVPLFSQATPNVKLKDSHVLELTNAVQTSPIDIFECRTEKHGPAALASAFGAARFIISMIRGIVGQPNIFETAYTKSDHMPSCTYFSGPFQLGANGIERKIDLPKNITKYEEELLKCAILQIQSDIRMGESMMRKKISREEARRNETPSQKDAPCAPIICK